MRNASIRDDDPKDKRNPCMRLGPGSMSGGYAPLPNRFHLRYWITGMFNDPSAPARFRTTTRNSAVSGLSFTSLR